jgi:tetratricopeptide (TPR) repeat protein
MEQETAKQQYQTAIKNFERGNYTAASRLLEQALAMVNPQTKLGGEIQIWLVNAYEASGKSQQAIALCRQLTKHVDYDVRQSARYVLGIISAPQLVQREGLVSAIPSLDELALGDPSDRLSLKAQQQIKLKPKSPEAKPELDLSIPPQPTIIPNSGRFMAVVMAILLLSLVVWAIA